MNLVPSMVLLITAATVISSCNASAEEKFKKLSGTQIRAKIIGMEITDDVHWADVYGANGALTTYAMGLKTNGKWRIEKDQLCVDRGKDDTGCYQVLISGKKIELRSNGGRLPLEGVLQKPTVRH